MSLAIRKVDGTKKSDLLRELHDECFGDSAPIPDTTYGYWWVVFDNSTPVGFAAMVKSSIEHDVGYLKRSGVLPSHRGQGLQRRLLRVREAQARRNGWRAIVSDTSLLNVHSSNNLMRSGYRLFNPEHRWAFKNGLYWIKELT